MSTFNKEYDGLATIIINKHEKIRFLNCYHDAQH